MIACVLPIVCACTVVFSVASPVESVAAGILYVDDDASPGGDGYTWSTAIRHLQDALGAARIDPGVREIRVAEGTYRPDQGIGQTRGDRYATFQLVSGTAVRGGYAGLSHRDPDSRATDDFVTTMSGDLVGDDQPAFVNYTDNSFRVVQAVGLPSPAVVDGCTVTGAQGSAADLFYGGGLYAIDSTLHLTDCRVHRNLGYRGGGMAFRRSTVFVSQCQFTGNRSPFGGAILAHVMTGESPVITIHECSFEMNEAIPEDGGALALGGATALVQHSTFRGNRADDGGAILGNPRVFDCEFTENYADYSGAVAGGGYYAECRFERNTAAVSGGGYGEITLNAMNHARFSDCTFINNSTNIQGGGAAYGGKEFINCRFIGNESGLAGGGPFAPGGAIHATVPTMITNCEFSGNAAPGVGGAIVVNAGIPVTISNSTFTNSHSDVTGEAIYGPAIICNSIFGRHDGPPLSGVTSVDYSCLPSPPPIAGVGNIIADPRFVDPLGPDGVAGTEDDDLRLRADSPCIDAGDSTALPADQFDLDGDGDTAEALPVDILGNRRVLFAAPHASPPDVGVPDATGAIIDMGAFEFRRPIDCAPPTPPIGDGFVNIDDLLMVISGWGDCPKRPAPCLADVNADGAVNIDDLLAVVTGWG